MFKSRRQRYDAKNRFRTKIIGKKNYSIKNNQNNNISAVKMHGRARIFFLNVCLFYFFSSNKLFMQYFYSCKNINIIQIRTQTQDII